MRAFTFRVALEIFFFSELLASVNPDAGLGENAEDEYYERRALRADFIRNHPTYDKEFRRSAGSASCASR